MKLLIFGLVFHTVITKSWMEPMTSIQIQNYDGPIYLHGPVTCSDECSKALHISKDSYHRSPCDTECSCVSKPTTICIPINTASESSCNAGSFYIGTNPQCSVVCPSQCDTQIYYTMEAQKNSGCCPKVADCCSLKHCPRDDKCNNHCLKCH